MHEEENGIDDSDVQNPIPSKQLDRRDDDVRIRTAELISVPHTDCIIARLPVDILTMLLSYLSAQSTFALWKCGQTWLNHQMKFLQLII